MPASRALPRPTAGWINMDLAPEGAREKVVQAIPRLEADRRLLGPIEMKCGYAWVRFDGITPDEFRALRSRGVTVYQLDDSVLKHGRLL